MKKKAVLRVLAMLLVFVMATSNVFATVEPTQTLAGETGTEKAAWKLSSEIPNVTADTEKGTITIESAAFTVAVTGSQAISNYQPTNVTNVKIKEALADVFTIASGTSEVVVNVNIPADATEKSYSIGAESIALVQQDGTLLALNSASAITITVISEDDSSSEEESSSGNENESTSTEETTVSDEAASEVAKELEKKAQEIEAFTGSDEELEGLINEVVEELDSNLVGVLNSSNSNSNNARDAYKELDKAIRDKKGIELENNVTVESGVFESDADIEVAGLALADVNKGSKVGLNVETPSSPKTPEALQEQVKDIKINGNPVKVKTSVQLTISLRGEGLTNDKLRAPVMIKIPMPVALKGKNTDNIRILHFGATQSIIPTVVIDGKIIFSVTHFSDFALVEIEEVKSEDPTVPSDPGGNTTPTIPNYRPSYSRPSGSSSSSSASSTVSTTTTAATTWVKNAAGGWRLKLANGTYPVNQWLMVDSKWYFFDGDTNMAEGWRQISGKWYYLNPSEGNMAEGWKMISGKWYYLNPSEGNMAEGWKMVDGKWYYLNPSDGDMATGWKLVDGKWYYLDPTNGDCWLNTTTPDGFKVDENGAWIQ